MRQGDRVIPTAVPRVGKDELQAIRGVLLSRWLRQGPEVEEFERRFANYIGTKFAVAVSSGTVALHLSLLAHDIGPGDEVVIPTFTYIGTANAVLCTGAKPIFIDIDLCTCNMDRMMEMSSTTRRFSLLS